MSGKLLVNGVDIFTTLGFGTRNVQAWWDSFPLAIPSTTPYKSFGSLRGSGHSVAPKPWPIALFLDKSTYADRQTQIDALLRVLAQTPLYQAEHRLSQTDEVSIQVLGADRLVYAVLIGSKVAPPGGLDFLSGHADIVLDFKQFDPTKYSTPETQALSTTEAEIELGTVGSHWEAEIYGPATDPEMIVFADDGGSPGAELWRISLVGTIGSGESFIIDELLHRVLKDDGAVETDVTETAVPLNSGEEFRRLDSGENESVWVELSESTGLLSWRKNWR